LRLQDFAESVYKFQELSFENYQVKQLKLINQGYKPTTLT